MSTATLPTHISDDINARILAVSEDRIQGFQEDPMGEISRLSGVDLPVVIEIVDAEDKINAFLPALKTMMGGGLVTIEKVQALQYGINRL